MSEQNRIKVRVDGPLLGTGDVAIYAADGKLLEQTNDVALCRCGQSANKPYCDGSHHRVNFSHDGCFTDARSEPLGEEGRLEIKVCTNAMLMLKGPVTIVSADGSCTSTRNKAALCRCGRSENKPFCDGAHKKT